MKVKCWNMAAMKMSVLWMGTFSIIFSAHLFSVSSAPLSNNQLFYNRLYQNSSVLGCSLPKVNESFVNYTSSKINHLCDSERGKNSDRSLCNALSDLFPRLCQTPSTSSKVNVTSLVFFDLMKVGSLGIQKVCSNLQELQSNISRTAGEQKLVSPFFTATASNQVSGNEHDLCISLCKNSRDIREGFREDNILNVNPACILLLEGYIIFQQKSVGNLYGSNAVGPSPVTLSGNEISSSKGAVKVAASTVTSNEVSKTMRVVGARIADKENLPPVKSTSPNAKEEMDRVVVGVTESTVDSNTEKIRPLLEQSSSTVREKGDDNSMKNIDILNKDHLLDKAEPVPDSKKIKDPNLVDDSINQKDSNKKEKNTLSSSTTTTTTTTTEAAIDARENEEPMPIEKENTIKSSTAVPKIVKFADEKDKDKVVPVTNVVDYINSEKSTPIKNKKKPSKAADLSKKPEESDALAGLGDDDGADYNPGEDLDNGLMKTPAGEDDKVELDIPQPETQNLGYDADSSYKPPPKNRFSGNAFREDVGFGRGTTINVSLKESEDTGFFNYFLFCVTLVGLVYLIIHNKKKLIAFVVEGKRPRGRSRRSSTSSQYRRLENNFD